MSKNILITGSAGFIGFHLTKALLDKGFRVTGIDNLNDYYDPKLKINRLRNLDEFVKIHNLSEFYRFLKLDISDNKELGKLFNDSGFNIVINLAAQAGVRYSLENPKAYINSNLVGFTNILEFCRQYPVEHFIYASSSSVYGMNVKQPFSVDDNTDRPVSLYAATKKSNEVLAHSYSHLFNIPSTGLRFFTVYGPFGRPDMAYYSFTQAIDQGKTIDVYNKGKMKRDFTYIDDIVDGIIRLLDFAPTRASSKTSTAESSSQIFNIGNNNPVSLDRFISAIEDSLGKKANRNELGMQPGDVPITYANIDTFVERTGFTPSISIEKGIKSFVDWYVSSNKESQ